jgi:hypothetical protein
MADNESDNEVIMAFPKMPVFIPVALLFLFLGGIGFGAPAASAAGADVSIQPVQAVRIETIASMKVGETRPARNIPSST